MDGVSLLYLQTINGACPRCGGRKWMNSTTTGQTESLVCAGCGWPLRLTADSMIMEWGEGGHPVAELTDLDDPRARTRRSLPPSADGGEE